MLVAADVADAAQFAVDISGSTITYPATGTVTLTLKDTSTGVVQASQVFDWVKVGALIKLSDPDAVNDWALANGGSANEMTYKLTKFPLVSGCGEQTISVRSLYENEEAAASVSTYYRCTTYPSPYQCAQL